LLPQLSREWTTSDSGCEIFGIDYGSFIVCWYWWFLAVLGGTLTAGTGILVAGHRAVIEGVLAGQFRQRVDDDD